MRAIIVGFLLAASVASASAGIVVGNGKMETEKRSVGAFSSISVKGAGTLRVHRGSLKVEVTGDSNIVPLVTTTVRGDELVIGLKPFTTIMKQTRLEFEVTLPELEAVRVAGSANAYVDAFAGGDFRADVAGSGGIKMELDYDSVRLNCSGSGGFDGRVKAGRLELRCSGSGGAYLTGSADRADVALTGSGTLGARKFSAGEAWIVISGSGEAELGVRKSLDAILSGSGSIKYWGDPSVSQRVSGSGRILRAQG